MTGAVPEPGDLWVGKIAGVGGLAISFAEFAAGDRWTDWDHVLTYAGYFTAAQILAVEGEVAGGYRDGCYGAEAEPSGARLRWLAPSPAHLRAMTPGLWSTGAFDLTDAQRSVITRYQIDAVAERIGYSWADYGAIGLHRLHVPAPHLRAFIKASGHQQCAQLADSGYQHADYKIFDDGRWCGDVMPADIGWEIRRRLDIYAALRAPGGM